MKLISATLLVLAFLAFLAFPATAGPLVKVPGGYVDWCQGFTDKKQEAVCVNGQFAFDWEGNIAEDLDGPGPDDDDDS